MARPSPVPVGNQRGRKCAGFPTIKDRPGTVTGRHFPAVERRRVGLALRRARATNGLTQHEVAEEMEWSLPKVIRIENGEVAIAPNELRVLLDSYRFEGE